jgi:4-hydroxybenzoate polyprenyltransferase
MIESYKQKRSHAKALLKLIRLKTLFWFGISTCYGFASVILNSSPPFHFSYLVLTIVFANIGAIIVNDIGDIQVDSKSIEISKRSRPLVTGEITKKEAIKLSAIAFSLSLAISMLYGISATLFSITIIIFALSYSLPPFKFCARPYGSILYWIALCIVCYLLMVLSLENINRQFSLEFTGTLLTRKQGWVFIIGIILFMGIAEIIAKDLRDKINDADGGRNTFVNYAGVELSTKILILFAWLGLILWIEALYLSDLYPNSISAWLCMAIGVVTCIRIHALSTVLMKSFNQNAAIKLHKEWTYAYAAMQVLTFTSFYFKESS